MVLFATNELHLTKKRTQAPLKFHANLFLGVYNMDYAYIVFS